MRKRHLRIKQRPPVRARRRNPAPLISGGLLLLVFVLVVLTYMIQEYRIGVVAQMTSQPRTAVALGATAAAGWARPPTRTAGPTPTPLPLPPTLALDNLVVVEASGAGSSAGRTSVIADYCRNFGSPSTIHIFDWTTGEQRNLTNPAIAQIPLAWDVSATFWRGYNAANPFDVPADTRERWRINLYLPTGEERWIEVAESAQTPQMVYVYVFERITPYADSRGQNFGFHPCRVFTLPSAQMYALLSAAGRQIVGDNQYPELADVTDPRWTRAVAQPLQTDVALRAVPSTENNDPISAITAVVNCWYISDPAWDGWAQVRLGNITGWVDTTTVVFLPSA
ncbi:MAG: hypothetical protein GYB67_06575 [Chloroflexi bacterium]|nr:hypothetical protein [Chloroflexota bacterium]